MYSIVLMSALATGGETPDFGWRSGGCVGSSCSGGVVSGCGGCTGYAVPVGCCGGTVVASGCCGGRGGLFAGLRSRLGGLFSRGCNGCGGCTGYAVSSCYGASCVGSSCLGSSCHGTSCYGSSCHGTSCYGGSSCYGSTTYYAPSYGVGSGCVGSGSGCFGSGITGDVIIGGTVAPFGRVDEAREYLASRATPTAAAPARLTVELPADAVLFVDGEKVTGTGAVRNFHTPNLPAGTFFYDLKAEVTVDGQTVSESVRVLVQAGDAKTESFGKLFAAVKAAKNPAVVSK